MILYCSGSSVPDAFATYKDDDDSHIVFPLLNDLCCHLDEDGVWIMGWSAGGAAERRENSRALGSMDGDSAPRGKQIALPGMCLGYFATHCLCEKSHEQER